MVLSQLGLLTKNIVASRLRYIILIDILRIAQKRKKECKEAAMIITYRESIGDIRHKTRTKIDASKLTC